MKHSTMKTRLALFVLAAMLFALASPVYADASLRIETSASTIAVGKTLTISVKVSGVPDLSAVGFDLKFDPAVFTYVSGSLNNNDLKGDTFTVQGSNTVQLVAYDCLFNTDSDPLLATFKFSAKAVSDKASFSISNIELGDYENASPVAATFSGAKSVTVFQPSTNADLSKLSIAPGTLSPAFTSANTVYNTQVADTVKSISVDATPADPKATVTSVTGHTNLINGENIIKVVVKAESGATKTYTIKAYKAVPTPTPEATPTPAATVLFDGNLFSVAVLDEGQEPPAGFTASTAILQGQTIPAYTNMTTNLTLLYLVDSTGKNDFFLYDANTGSFTIYQTLNIPARSFTVLQPDVGVAIPTGYSVAALTINGHTVSGFQENEPGADGVTRTLVYLMDSSGHKDLYVYDASSEAVLLFSAPEPDPTATATPEPTLTATPTPVASPTPLPVAVDTDSGSTYLLIILILAFLVVVMTGILIYLLVSRKAYNKAQKPPMIRRVR